MAKDKSIDTENQDVIDREIAAEASGDIEPSTDLASENTAATVFDPTTVNLPDLHADMEVSQISDLSEYWTPESEGDSKRVFFDSLSVETFVDEETGEEKALKVVLMWERIAGKLSKISNGSARLYGHFERSNYVQGQPLQVVYKGKQKNKNNSYQSDTWDVFKLYPKK